MASFWGPWAIAWGLTKIPSSQRIPLASTTSRQVDGFVCCFVVVAEHAGGRSWPKRCLSWIFNHGGGRIVALGCCFWADPFLFKNESAEIPTCLLRLLRDVESILWYIHLPFCSTQSRNIGSHVAALILEILPQNSLRIGQKRAVTSDSSRRANSVTEGTAESLAASIRPKRKTVAVAVSSWRSTHFSLRNPTREWDVKSSQGFGWMFHSNV